MFRNLEKFTKMKKFVKYALLAATAVSLLACKKESKIEMSFADKYEGKTVELISFADSAVLTSSVIKNGKATFYAQENDSIKFPLFTQIAIDGRIRAYHILENGSVVLADSMRVPQGTPLNKKFSVILSRLDSIENLDDMKLYSIEVEKLYNENKNSVFSPYLGVEWLKYAEPQKADSFLNLMPEQLRNSKRVKYYEKFAHLRGVTSAGMPYVDFAGETAIGKKQMFSSLIEPGKYTLVDFWASWCPYCIKELPELQQLYTDYHSKGLNIVGVAVRDKREDTTSMVKKKDISWSVLYNTQKIPYDIYGFSGIPHHMLIGPDGRIISRGENVEQIRERLQTIL